MRLGITNFISSINISMPFSNLVEFPMAFLTLVQNQEALIKSFQILTWQLNCQQHCYWLVPPKIIVSNSRKTQNTDSCPIPLCSFLFNTTQRHNPNTSTSTHFIWIILYTCVEQIIYRGRTFISRKALPLISILFVHIIKRTET